MKTIKKPKHLNKAILARQSIKRAKALIPLIRLQNDENSKSALYSALSVFYGKPFTESQRIGALSIEDIPTDYRDTHQKLIEYRHKVAAHSDGTFLVNDTVVNSVYFECDGKSVVVEELYPYPTEEFLSQIEALIDALNRALGKAINECLNKGPLSRQKYEKGRYQLSLEKSGDWLIKQ